VGYGFFSPDNSRRIEHLIFSKSGKRSLSVTFFIILQLAVPARAQDACLSSIQSTYSKDQLLVSFTVNNCFTDDMNRAIESGIDTTFTFFVKLYEKRDLWWDKKRLDGELSHSIKYDNLKKIYEVTLSEKDYKIITLTDYDEAKRLMSDVATLKVAPLDSLIKGRRYKLKMMAELDKIRLPFYLHYVFFFLSLWDFETDWHTIEFTY
jgi:hypothetical protein